MPIETSLDHEHHLIRYSLTGRLVTEEMLDAVRATFGRRKPGEIYDVISDHRLVEAPATPEQIKTLVAELLRQGHLEGMRAAVIVATDASYGMMRMFAAHAEPHGIHVGIFRHPDEARAFVERIKSN